MGVRDDNVGQGPALSAELLEEIAERFKVLGEPARLGILNTLRGVEELSVGELSECTGLSQANVSKHLGMLHRARFVARRKEGSFVYYRLANRDVFVLCEVMCGRLEAEYEARLELLHHSADEDVIF